MQKLQLTPEETARFAAFSDACRERTKGFEAGMEQARQMFLAYLVATRKAEDQQQKEN